MFFENSDFGGADLSNATFKSGSNADGPFYNIFQSANLANANLSGSNIVSTTDFSGADFVNASLNGAMFVDSGFTDEAGNPLGVSMQGANLTRADFSNVAFGDDIAATSTVTTVGTAHRHVRLAAEADTACVAIA